MPVPTHTRQTPQSVAPRPVTTSAASTPSEAGDRSGAALRAEVLTMTTMTAPGYIATDRDETAIYGIGPTAQTAIADAERGAVSWQRLGGVACTS